MKQANKIKLIDAVNTELKNLYHNARLPWTDDVSGFESFYDWINWQAEYEVDHINSGGAYGLKPYNEMDHIKKQAEKYQSEAARRLFLINNRNEYYKERAKYIDDHVKADYGTVYSYGRGGATLAPKEWIKDRGGCGFSPVQYAYGDNETPRAELLTELLHDVRAWNKYVKAWCKGAPAMYNEAAYEALNSEITDNKQELHAINASALKLIREIKQAGATLSPNICEVLKRELKTIINNKKALYNNKKALYNNIKSLSNSLKVITL